MPSARVRSSLRQEALLLVGDGILNRSRYGERAVAGSAEIIAPARAYRLCPLVLRWILRTVFPLFRAINDAVTGHIEKLSTIMGRGWWTRPEESSTGEGHPDDIEPPRAPTTVDTAVRSIPP
ncbi:MAG: hypothetical protein V3U63_00075 [Gemmatimonadota bacterium]